MYDILRMNQASCVTLVTHAKLRQINTSNRTHNNQFNSISSHPLDLETLSQSAVTLQF